MVSCYGAILCDGVKSTQNGLVHNMTDTLVREIELTRLDASTNLVIFEQQTSFRASEETFKAVASFVKQHVVVHALSDILSKAAIGWPDLPASRQYYVPEPDGPSAIDMTWMLNRQLSQWMRSGFIFDEKYNLVAPTNIGPITIAFELERSQFGSYFSGDRLKITFPDSEQFSIPVLVNLVSHALILACGVIYVEMTTSEGETGLYTCYLNSFIEGNPGEIMQSAVNDLTLSSNATEAERYRVLHGIQLCLNIIGLYHDEPDGLWGPKTEAALQEFSDRNGIAVPQWHHENFVRALLIAAADAMEKTDQKLRITNLQSGQETGPKRTGGL